MTRVLGVVAALAVACSHHPGELQLVDVTRGDLVLGVEVTGELEAVDSTDVKPPPLSNMWNFKIASIAPEGSDVSVGDPVIGFDPSEQIRDLETMKNEADAAQKKLDKKRDDAALVQRDDELKIAQAEATLRKASLKADAPPDLVATVVQRGVQLDEQAAKLALESAKNHAAQARRSDAEEIQRLTDNAAYVNHVVEVLEKDITRMNIVASRAGTIVYPANDSGEKHKVGDNVWRMEDVLQIVGLGKMIGNGQVDEVDIARLADKQPVSLRLDALPDVQLHGTIASIAKSVQAKSPTEPSKIVKLKMTISAAATTPLRPGMRFRGQVETERLPGVVQVPAEAVFVTPDGAVAYRETTNGVERVVLTLGRRNATAIEVKSGLTAGDRVSRIDPGAAR